MILASLYWHAAWYIWLAKLSHWRFGDVSVYHVCLSPSPGVSQSKLCISSNYGLDLDVTFILSPHLLWFPAFPLFVNWPQCVPELNLFCPLVPTCPTIRVGTYVYTDLFDLTDATKTLNSCEDLHIDFPVILRAKNILPRKALVCASVLFFVIAFFRFFFRETLSLAQYFVVIVIVVVVVLHSLD